MARALTAQLLISSGECLRRRSAAFDIATALYAGLRSVTIIRGFTDTLLPLFQASEIAELQTRGLMLYKDIDISVQRFEVFIADLAMRLSTDNPRIGQYIGYIAN